MLHDSAAAPRELTRERHGGTEVFASARRRPPAGKGLNGGGTHPDRVWGNTGARDWVGTCSTRSLIFEGKNGDVVKRIPTTERREHGDAEEGGAKEEAIDVHVPKTDRGFRGFHG